MLYMLRVRASGTVCAVLLLFRTPPRVVSQDTNRLRARTSDSSDNKRFLASPPISPRDGGSHAQGLPTIKRSLASLPCSLRVAAPTRKVYLHKRPPTPCVAASTTEGRRRPRARFSEANSVATLLHRPKLCQRRRLHAARSQLGQWRG